MILNEGFYGYILFCCMNWVFEISLLLELDIMFGGGGEVEWEDEGELGGL